jgi:signal transduction histidine kinase
VVANDLVRAISTLGEELAAGLAADQAGPCPEFRVRAEGTTRDLVPLVRDEVHRIGCEAVRNAFRHAQASRIEVAIHYDRRQLRLRVCDNGKGLDQSVVGEAGRPGHFGLPGMQERAKLAGGKLALLSRRDSGTEVELTIPAALAYAESPVATRPRSLGKGT